jgi:hypothetical protein
MGIFFYIKSRNRLTRPLLCFLFFSFTITCSGQLIVNVESSRIQSDTTGWKGDIGTSFSFVNNVQQLLNINVNTHLQYKTEKDLYLLLTNYNLLKSNNQSLSDNIFFHLRYNRKLGKVVRWEAFTQWQQNKITSIDVRALLGTGPRFKLADSKKIKLYAGVLAMYEYERDINPVEIHEDIRSDNYVSVTYKPTPIIDVTATAFYQPLFRDISDYRILNQFVLNIRATTHFSIVTSWDYLFDSYPAVGTPKVNYTINNGFTYSF